MTAEQKKQVKSLIGEISAKADEISAIFEGDKSGEGFAVVTSFVYGEEQIQTEVTGYKCKPMLSAIAKRCVEIINR